MEFPTQNPSTELKVAPAVVGQSKIEQWSREAAAVLNGKSIDYWRDKRRADVLELYNELMVKIIAELERGQEREAMRDRPIQINASGYRVDAGGVCYRDGVLYVIGEKNGHPVVLNHRGDIDLPLEIDGKIEAMSAARSGQLYFIVKQENGEKFVFDADGNALIKEDGFGGESVNDLCLDDGDRLFVLTYESKDGNNYHRLYAADGRKILEGGSLLMETKVGRHFYFRIDKNFVRSDEQMAGHIDSFIDLPHNFRSDEAQLYVISHRTSSGVYDEHWRRDDRFNKLDKYQRVYRVGEHIYCVGTKGGKDCLERDDGEVIEFLAGLGLVRDILPYGDRVALSVERWDYDKGSTSYEVIDQSGREIVKNSFERSRPVVKCVGGTIYSMNIKEVKGNIESVYADSAHGGEVIGFEANLTIRSQTSSFAAALHDFGGQLAISGMIDQLRKMAVFNRKGRKISEYYDEIFGVYPIVDKPGCAWVVAKKGDLYVKHEIGVTRQIPVGDEIQFSHKYADQRDPTTWPDPDITSDDELDFLHKRPNGLITKSKN